MLFLNLLSKLIKSLNSEASPLQLAFGVVLGMFIGLTPPNFLMDVLLVFLALILNVALSGVGLGALVFTLVRGVGGIALAQTCHHLGEWVLTLPALKTVFVVLSKLPLMSYTQFNHTVMMGSLILSLLLSLPLIVGVRLGVIKYRDVVMTKFKKWKVVQLILASRLGKFLLRVKGALS